ncbi:MAG: hypothetical protein K6343_05775 [Caldisericaceae bacterium]
MKKKLEKKKRKNIKHIVIALLVSLVIILSGAFISYKLLTLKESILTETHVKSLSENPTCAISVGDNLLIGNAQGYVALFSPTGESKFIKKIDEKVFGIVHNKSNNSFIVACTSYHVLDENFKELCKIGFENFIPKDPYVAFLENGDMMFVFQSLKDLSYQIVRVNSACKVVSKNVIPDMGQNSSLAINSSGNVALALENGDLYILSGDKILKQDHTTLKNSMSSYVNSIFVNFLNGGNIVSGYRNLVVDPTAKEKLSLKVVFFSNQLVKQNTVEFSSSINNILPLQNKIVFSTSSGFYFYNSNGELLNSIPKIDNIPYAYFENSLTQLFLYKGENNDKNYYQLILKENNGKEIGRFVKIFNIDNPIFVLSQNSKSFYVIEGTEITLIQK